MTIREAYLQSLRREGHVEDPAQLDVIARFEDLQQRLAAQPPRRGGLRTLYFRSEPRETVRGLYIWGGVGRGKTFLMDLFFESLETDRKRRIHFHRMMHDVHERMKRLSFVEDPLDKIAAGALGAGVLLVAVCVGNDCDEPCLRQVASSARYSFHVRDIDALKAAFSGLEAALGPAGVLVNNAARVERSTLETTDAETTEDDP